MSHVGVRARAAGPSLTGARLPRAQAANACPVARPGGTAARDALRPPPTPAREPYVSDLVFTADFTATIQWVAGRS